MSNWYDEESTTWKVLITKVAYTHVCLHETLVSVWEVYMIRIYRKAIDMFCMSQLSRNNRIIYKAL